ncbi:MAG: hypothetical protein HYV16_12010 [Gammaproteobacteria bacterium]|nr:hypothetical protein [Gammaproteobacteria bacterium]
MKNPSAIAFAVAAASLFAMAPITAAQANDAGVQCWGTNECKGHNDCKTDKNACKGHAECKGQGWVHMDSEKACTDKGGKVERQHKHEETK